MRIKHHAWRGFIAVSGGLVIIIGLILVPLPGPGWLVVAIGLAILATEFAWAENLLSKIRKFIKRKTQRLQKKNWFSVVDKHHDENK